MNTPTFGFPRAVRAEWVVDGAWEPIETSGTSDIRQTDTVTISRGRGDEQTTMPPSKLSEQLDNADGKYTRSNPLSALYGHLGPNTPVRQGIDVAADSFGRTVASGWGTSDTGNVWVQQGGSFATSVGAGIGSQFVQATSAWGLCHASPAIKNGYMAITYRPAFTNVTGGPIEIRGVMRYLDIDNFYYVRVMITTAEEYKLEISRVRDNVYTGLTSITAAIPGLSHSTAQPVRIAVAMEGRTMLAKVWPAASSEPYLWQQIASENMDDLAIDTAGSWGWGSSIDGLNTNALPVRFDFDDLEVRLIRVAGELTDLTPSWNLTHTLKTADLQVSGILQRLGQGRAPVRSALRRHYDARMLDPGTDVVAYWPLEDERESDYAGSGLAEGGAPMYWNGDGTVPSFAGNSDFIASAPLVSLAATDFQGEVTPHTFTGTYSIRWLLQVPDGGTTDLDVIARYYFHSGNWWFIDIMYHTGGGLSFKTYDFNQLQTHDSGSMAFNVNGKLLWMQLELDQDGTDIDWSLSALEVGQTVKTTFSGTHFPEFLGPIARVMFAPYRGLSGTVIGHVGVANAIIDDVEDHANLLLANVGETTGNRFLRLCQENGIDGQVWGDKDAGALMGPQKTEALVPLLIGCATTEQGLMFEAMLHPMLFLRMRHNLYAQDPALILDYANGEVAPDLIPASDDQGLRNIITASRVDGSSYVEALLEGPRNAGNPWEDPDAVGQYTGDVTVNTLTDAALIDVAGHALREGTFPDTRYPSIAVYLHDMWADANITEAQMIAVLSVNIGDRVQIVNMQDADIYTLIDQMVQGISETHGNQYLHQIGFNCSPYWPWNILVLDVGRLAGTVVTTEALDTTETGVDFSSVAPMVTAVGEFPVNILCEGEEMTVTAASGTTTGTLTVIRSVNGVVKAHASGAVLTLADDNSFLGR